MPYYLADCEYCAQIARVFTRANRILFQNDAFTIWPSLGALEKGHLLVIPNHHIEASTCVANGYLEMIDLVIEYISKHSIFSKSNLLVAEHGSLSKNDTLKREKLNCVDHAHIHLIPSEIDLQTIFSQYRMLMAPIEPIHVQQLAELRCYDNTEYNLVGSPKTGYFYYPNTFDVESQVIRRVYCGLKGKSDTFDWRKFPEKQKVIATRDAFRDYVGSIPGNSCLNWENQQSELDLGV